jgi:hypothetical protein
MVGCFAAAPETGCFTVCVVYCERALMVETVERGGQARK